MFKILKSVILTSCALLMTACSTIDKSKNEINTGENAYQAEYRDFRGKAKANSSREMNKARCLKVDEEKKRPETLITSDEEVKAFDNAISKNDLVEILVEGDGFFSDNFIVNQQGQLTLPFLPSVRAAGKTPEMIEEIIANSLFEENHYDDRPRVSVRIKEYGKIRIHLSGAVYEEGAYIINSNSAVDIDKNRTQAIGDYTNSRRLSRALRAAAGVRPDADITRIEVRRAGKVLSVDMTDIHQGKLGFDPLVIADDEIYVYTRNCFQDYLAKVSPITRPGVSIRISNLTEPAKSNAASTSTANGTGYVYGLRMLDALITMNCVGGVYNTTARRYATLITKNPLTGEVIAINRNIEKVIRHKSREAYNPVLLPGDAMACYDSRITNVRDVVSIMSEILQPLIFIGFQR